MDTDITHCLVHRVRQITGGIDNGIVRDELTLSTMVELNAAGDYVRMGWMGTICVAGCKRECYQRRQVGAPSRSRL